MCVSELIDGGPGVRDECDGGGDLAKCQLCPNSSTYWQRTTRTPAAADPWSTEPSSYAPAPAVPDDLADLYERDDYSTWPVIDVKNGWTAVRSGIAGVCVLCRKTTWQLSPKGLPCHLTCANDWNDRNRDRMQRQELLTKGKRGDATPGN